MKNSYRVGTRLAALITVALTMEAYADRTATQPVTKATLHRVDARIEAIDPAARTISLRSSNGVTTIAAGPQMRNFDSMRVGDKVRASYYEATAAQIRKQGAAAQGESSEAALLYRAPPGSRPAGAIAHATNATVRIESIDKKANTVTFSKSDECVTIEVPSAEGRSFIRTLHPGDAVEVTYIEAMAIEVVSLE